MTSEQLYDLQMLGEHIKRYCEAVRNYRLMIHTIPERAERLRRTGVTNPLPALERETLEQLDRINLERMDVDVCLKSLGLSDLPEAFDDINEFITI